MKHLILITLISSLSLTGCLDFTTSSKSKDEPLGLTLLWEYSYDPDGGAPRVKPLIFEDVIITSGDKKVTSLDYKTGEMIWKTPFENHRQLTNRTFGLRENILTGSINNYLLAWDANSGDSLFELNFPDSLSFSSYSGILTTTTDFFAVSSGRRVFNIKSDGKLKVIDTDARSYEMFYDNGIVYTGQVKNMEGMVSAYDVNTFELLWRFNPGGLAYPAYTAPIVENNIVYIGTTAGPTGSRNGFFALNAQTGEEIWRREGIFTYSAVLAGDRIFGVNGQRVWALDKHTGELLWITRGQGGHSESNLDYLDGYVYWAHGGGLHVFDAESGELLHVLPAPDGSFFWRVTAGAGRIFAQSSSHLYAFAPWGHKQPLE